MSTAIEWTDETWNPMTGCTKVSQGCKNCWSKSLHDMRHKAFLNGKKMPAQYSEPFEVVKCHIDRLQIPLHWRQGRMCFSPSGADPFHEDVGQGFLDRFFVVIALTKHVTYQVLTKRADRMVEYFHGLRDDEVRARRWSQIACELTDSPCAAGLIEDLPWPLPNLWPGVSVENRDALPRMDALRRIPAACRMVSFEPLLEDLGEIDLTGIGWGIVGGESGKNARQFNPFWAIGILRQFRRAGEAFFMKQFGSNCYWRDPDAPLKLKDRNGGDPDEWPEEIRVREFPKPYAGHTVIRLQRKSREVAANAPKSEEDTYAKES
jgi:protein gp37